MNQSLTISFVPAPPISATDGPWLTLEQEYIPEWSQSASLADIKAMWDMAVTGLSAVNYNADRCPVTITDGTITVFLGIYVFPSALDLDYKLTLFNGVLGDVVEKTVARDFDLLIPQSASVSLDFIPEDDIEFEWQTEAYNALGERIERPEITVDKNVVTLSESCFAVLRCTCTTIAHYYPVYLFVVKAAVVVDTEAEAKTKADCIAACDAQFGSGSLDPNYNLYLPCVNSCDQAIKTNKPPDRTGYKITNLQCTAQATWTGTDGKISDKSLSLKIPECVKHLLEMCDDGKMKNSSFNISDTDTEGTVIAYFSTCTGNILDVQRERADPNHPIHRRSTR